MNNEKIYYMKLELIIAKLYIFLLPIRMINIFLPFTVYFKDCAKYLDFLLGMLGLLLIIMRSMVTRKLSNGSIKENLFRFFVLMITIFNITSFLMAIVIDNRYGIYAGESSYSAVLKMALIFIQYILMVFYNKEIFKLLGGTKIKEIISKSISLLLVVGYIQLLIMIGCTSLEALCNKIDILDIFEDSIATLKMPLTESEGALAGDLIAIFVLPFLASNVILEKNKKSYFIQILAWIPLIIISESLSEYILCTVFFITFGVYLFKESDKSINIKYIVLIPIIVIIAASILWGKLPNNIKDNIIYTITEKISDDNNGSTVTRTTIPLKYNIGAFKEYPLLGVGNGNQGYFYYKYVDHKYSFISGVNKSYINAANTIYNGGLFFPSILSGYGIVGIILLIIYIFKSDRAVNENKKELGIYYYYYKMARIPFLLAGFQTLFVGTYYIWFVLSIPFFKTICDNKE